MSAASWATWTAPSTTGIQSTKAPWQALIVSCRRLKEHIQESLYMSYHASTGRRTTIVRFCEALGAGASVHQVKHRHQKGEVARSLGITICVDDAYECVHSMALACPNWQTGIPFGGRPTPQGFRHDAWVLQRTIVCGDTKDQRPKTKEHHSEYRKQRNDWSNQGKNIQMYRDANGSGHPTHPIAKTGLPGKGQLQLEHLLRFVGAMLVACNIYDFFFQWHPTVSRALHSAPPTVSDKRKTSIILRKKTDRNPPSRAHQCTNSFCPLAGMWIMEDKLLVEFVASTCVAGAAFGPWYCLWKKSWWYNCLVLQLFGNYSKHRPKTKDQRPAAS